ncbi:MAG: DUF5107 domain-containing protein [Balneolaceae bacterium]|nr:DUF5107 domain-containing protein [Balneolaceae bacterium]
MKWFFSAFPLFILLSLITQHSSDKTEDKSASISKNYETITTYPFGDPSPIPIFADITNQRGSVNIYPYFSFNNYSQQGEERDWEVITMENDYIEVTILPEVGGKVWGAIEKSTGHEFIYKNHVKKFRDIALRGPWTSGGIEFNFGIVGHTPATAHPVDYLIREHEDGSVSTVIGGLDLPSRTEWRVEITLPADKAYFETESFWYNPLPMEQSNYVWMNAAAEAREDLQLIYPGTHYVGHSGDAHPWPVNADGVDLSWYRNNDFGGSKSYHVLGQKTEYFGGYWHDKDFGFGNWSLYSDMPGKKLWIWALSQAGGIWEDLLTDEDGQYIEFQSGRLFSQAIGRSIETPFNYDILQPDITEQWSEIWFPVVQTGGISAASPHAVLHLHPSDNHSTELRLMALQPVSDELHIRSSAGSTTLSVELNPLEMFTHTIETEVQDDELRVELGHQKLVYDSSEDFRKLNRPLQTLVDTEISSAGKHYQDAINHIADRNYPDAYQELHAALVKDPAFTPAYNTLANIYYKQGEYEKAIHQAKIALSQNTYDPGANHVYGLSKKRMGQPVMALEALGWAARSLQHRSGAYASMAEIYLEKTLYDRAETYAKRSLHYNQSQIPALKVLAVLHRKLNQTDQAVAVLETMLEIDPLNHFARFEQYLLSGNEEDLNIFSSMIRNELPHETYLELAVYYSNLGFSDEAVQVLNQSPPAAMVDYWLAYLHRDENQSSEYLSRAVEKSPFLVFPFRPESIPVLKWAASENPSWKNDYYLGLIHWSTGRKDDAVEIFDHLDFDPDYAPFYLARGTLRGDLDYESERILRDFEYSAELAPDEWRTWHHLNTYYLRHSMWDDALETAERSARNFPEVDAISIDYAKALLHTRNYEQAADHLQNTQILPFYQAGESRALFEQSNILHAAQLLKEDRFNEALTYIEYARTWPENLAVGKPFDPDLRLQNFMEAAAQKQLDNRNRAEELFREITAYTADFSTRWGAGHYSAILTFIETGQSEEAERLLENWANAQPDQVQLQWANAHFKGDETLIRQIEQEHTDNLQLQLFAQSVRAANNLLQHD